MRHLYISRKIKLMSMDVLGSSSTWNCRILNCFDFFSTAPACIKQQQIFKIQNSTRPNRWANKDIYSFFFMMGILFQFLFFLILQKTDACKKPEFTIPHYTGGEDDWSSGGEDWRQSFTMHIVTSHLKHSVVKGNLNKTDKNNYHSMKA